MSITPSPGNALPPEPEPPAVSEPTRTLFQPAVSGASRNWFQPAVIAALVVLVIAHAFVFHELSGTRKLLDQQITDLKERNSMLGRRLEAGEERHNSLRGEVLMTQEKLGVTQRDLGRARELAKTLSEEAKRTAAAQIGQVGQQVSSLREESTARLGALGGEVTTAKSDIAATRKDLEQTRIQLTSAIGDISKANVLIARNHDELVELKRRGERNYYEFDLPKEKQPRRIGEVSLLLKKADPKRQRYTLEVIAEDVRTEKKDKTVNEPVQFYMGRPRGLHEIVVNKVGKDRVIGYVSTPK